MVCIWVPFSGRMDGLGDTGIDLHCHGCGSIPSHSFVADSNGKKLFHCKPSPPHLCVTVGFTVNAGSRSIGSLVHISLRCTIRDTKCGPNWLH